MAVAIGSYHRKDTKGLSATELEELRARGDSRIVRVCTADGHVEWSRRVASSTRSWSPGNPTGDGRQMALDRTGSRLAMCDHRGNLCVWDGAGTPLREFSRQMHTNGAACQNTGSFTIWR